MIGFVALLFFAGGLWLAWAGRDEDAAGIWKLALTGCMWLVALLLIRA